MTCTWVNCTADGEWEQKAQDGSIWATLCPGHHEELEQALNSGDAKMMLSCWVRAQGGAKAAAKRMEPTTQRIAAVVNKWNKRKV